MMKQNRSLISRECKLYGNLKFTTMGKDILKNLVGQPERKGQF